MYSKTIQRELCLKPILHFALRLRFGAKTRENVRKKLARVFTQRIV